MAYLECRHSPYFCVSLATVAAWTIPSRPDSTVVLAAGVWWCGFGPPVPGPALQPPHASSPPRAARSPSRAAKVRSCPSTTPYWRSRAGASPFWISRRLLARAAVFRVGGPFAVSLQGCRLGYMSALEVGARGFPMGARPRATPRLCMPQAALPMVAGSRFSRSLPAARSLRGGRRGFRSCPGPLRGN